MGTFTVTVEIGDPQGQRFEEVEALVDTGATYTSLPATLLRRLGVSPRSERWFVLADDRRIQRSLGETSMRLGGEWHPVLVVFGDDDEPVALGRLILEVFGLEPDSANERLVPVDGLLMGSSA
ncbi:MAG: aspartyl protease family protein [Chloroflexi bacterium]|nr:aspartyl protease family protein [Chloroflexota bacterium]